MTSITTSFAPGFHDINENDVTNELIGKKVDASEAIKNLIKEDGMEDEHKQPAAMSKPLSTIMRWLKMQQRIAEVIENVTEDKGSIDPNDLVTKLPKEPPYVGFNAEIDGTGYSGESIREVITRFVSEGEESEQPRSNLHRTTINHPIFISINRR